MNSKLPYNEVLAAYKRKLREAQFKAEDSICGPTKKKYEGLACLYESTIFYLENLLRKKV
jgi:hypothetical protein